MSLVISNRNNFSLNKSTVKAIEVYHAEKIGIGDVVLTHTNDNTDEAPIYDVWSLSQNYLFSIDTDCDVIFER